MHKAKTMKYAICIIFTCAPFFIAAQIPDSTVVAPDIDSLLATANVLWGRGEGEEAIYLAQQAADIAKKRWGEYNASFAASLHRLAGFYYGLSQNDKAENLYKDAIRLRSRVLGRDHQACIASMTNLGILYHSQGLYENAEPVFIEIASLRAQKSGVYHPDYAKSLNNLAVLYMDKNDFVKAEDYYQQAKEIWVKTLGEDHEHYATSLYNLAVLYMNKGDFVTSEQYYLSAIESRRRILGESHKDYALALNGFANLCSMKGDFSKAEPLYIDVGRIFAQASGEYHPDYAVFLNNFANLYGQKGDYAKAEPLFWRANEIWANTLGEQYPGYISTLSNLGLLYLEKGDYEKAESLFLEAKNIRIQSLGVEHPDYASSILKIADLYLKKGDYSRAEPLFLEAIEILKKTLGTKHPQYGMSLCDLASLYLNLKTDKPDHEKIESLFTEAIEIFKETVGEQHPHYANTLNNLAILYEMNNDYPNAEKFYIEAKEIRKNAIGANHPDYAASLNNLAFFYTHKGEYFKAENLFDEAEAIFLNSLGEEHIYYTSTLSGLSNLFRLTGQFHKATDLILKVNSINRILIEKSAAYSSESQMLAYLHTFEDNSNQFYSFTQDNSNEDLIGRCFDNRLFLSEFLLENTRRLTYAVAASDSLTHETFLRWQGCRRRLANEYAKPISDRRYVAEVEAEAESHEKILIRNLPAFVEARHIPRWQDVRDRLQPGEAVIEFVHYRYFTPKATDSIMYAALVLLSGDAAPRFVPLFEEKQLQRLLNRPGLSEEIIIKDLYGNSLDLLHLLWQPLESQLVDVQTVYYSPSGLLHRLNPAALLDESGISIAKDRRWVRLVSSRELVSGRLADQSYALPHSANSTPIASLVANPPDAVIFGGITYDMDSTAFVAANPLSLADSIGVKPKDGDFRRVITKENSDGRGVAEWLWPPLPNSRIEAESVGALLSKAGFSIEVFRGYYASEERFKKAVSSSRSPHVVHIATHGFAFPTPIRDVGKGANDFEPTYKLLEDPMLRTGMVLAGANYYWKNKRPLADREDGVLVAYEVRGLNLQNTELVVLSACQTGLGDIVSSEGVYGLQRAFRIAGAKFLIVSLWQVPDKHTQELMQHFYKNWAERQEPLRDAFANAQAAMQKKYPNPFLWAGFVLLE